MQEIQKTETFVIAPKMYQGQRVVTFADIDNVHQKSKGQAKANFNRNKKHFIKGIDFVVITPTEFQKYQNDTSGIERKDINNRGTTFLTESGYLMIVKSFTDDLSWDVQRQLVNGYFRAKDMEMQPTLPQAQNEPIPTLPPATPNWYERNKTRMRALCERRNWDFKHLYHKILKECSEKYDLEQGKRIHYKYEGCDFEYAIDIVSYFPQLAEVADAYLDYLEENFLK